MKRYIVVIAVMLLVTVVPGYSADEAKDKAQLTEMYLKKDLATLKDLGKPTLSNEASVSLILFGDTQTYTPKIENQPVLDMMTSWVCANIRNLKIKGLLHVGDIIENNGIVDTFRGNQNSKQMWEWASHCFSRLDNRIPCILTAGNHEYGKLWGGEKGTSEFTRYFNPARNFKTQESLLQTYIPTGIKAHNLPPARLDSAFYKIEVGGAWGDIYVIALEFNPSKDILKWASKLLSEYNDKFVILLTHNYLNIDSTHSKTAKYLWEDFVKKTPAIKLVLCGHHCKPITDFEQTTAFREEVNDFGKKVSAMMFDPQCISGGFTGNGGDGWLRILELCPDGKTIKVKTYSPLFGYSPMTKSFAWRTAPYDMFDFTIDR